MTRRRRMVIIQYIISQLTTQETIVRLNRRRTWTHTGQTDRRETRSKDIKGSNERYLFYPSLIGLIVSADVKHHVYLLFIRTRQNQQIFQGNPLCQATKRHLKQLKGQKGWKMKCKAKPRICFWLSSFLFLFQFVYNVKVWTRSLVSVTCKKQSFFPCSLCQCLESTDGHERKARSVHEPSPARNCHLGNVSSIKNK